MTVLNKSPPTDSEPFKLPAAGSRRWKEALMRKNRLNEPVCFSRTDAAMFDVVSGDGAADDVAAARREVTAREEGKKTRSHSADVSRNQQSLSVKQEGKK